jgi:hypothetical protein
LEIWKNLAEWATDDKEKELLDTLINKADSFLNKNKPILSGHVFDPTTQEEYFCDLIWKQEKVVFILAENKDIVPIIEESGWTCFCGADKDLTGDEIIASIMEV